jgi:L-alanine-DL-glutamate epimerase-like enolase superfamily enzyme
VTNVFLRIDLAPREHGLALTGYGEACPYRRYGDDLATVVRELEGLSRADISWSDLLDQQDISSSSAQIANDSKLGAPAHAALDMALWDLWAKHRAAPLHRLWSRPNHPPRTSLTIGLSAPAEMAQAARAAVGFECLKVKLGHDGDKDVIRAIRQVTNVPLRVDANEGWTDRSTALDRIEWLAQHGVELVEQPLPAGRWDDMRWLKERSPIPLIADEDFRLEPEWDRLAMAYHGINIKLDKSGGLSTARRQLALARSLDLRVMVGCMVASSLAITAAAHIALTADWVDLDGHLLLANDPCSGLIATPAGELRLRHDAGLGVTVNEAIFA